jgi:hypothetical protein
MICDLVTLIVWGAVIDEYAAVMEWLAGEN